MTSFRPRHWGIATRSALVSGTVVLVGLALIGIVSLSLLWESLKAGLDDAGAARAGAVAAALQTQSPQEIDSDLFETDRRIDAVQIAGRDGKVIRGSGGGSRKPIASVRDRDDDVDKRGVAIQRVNGYTVLVKVDGDSAESTVATVGAMLLIVTPLIAGVSGTATYLLVRRSLRSVDAIRGRVAEISASDLAQRVPVPQSRDEIAALAVTMNEMLARVESGHAAQRRFVGDASHELRSPLATVISALEVGSAHPELLDTQLVAATLLPEAHRMQALVDDLLLLARADEDGLPLRREDVDLDDVADAEVERLRRESGLEVRADLSPTRITGDRNALARVLRNLADNALRHAGSTVTITVRSACGSAYVEVADDGPGIPVEDRQRVLERFVRLDSDRSRRGGGTGLGLAIVSEIVAAHGGTVLIGERSGGGALITVQLPENSPDSSR